MPLHKPLSCVLYTADYHYVGWYQLDRTCLLSDLSYRIVYSFSNIKKIFCRGIRLVWISLLFLIMKVFHICFVDLIFVVKIQCISFARPPLFAIKVCCTSCTKLSIYSIFKFNFRELLQNNLNQIHAIPHSAAAL